MKNIRNIIEQKYPPENPNDLWMKDNVLYKSTHKGWTPLTADGGSSTNGVISTTWQELKDKRDAGKLTPGALYRITDYNCTTTQENTQSAGHQFDIVLLALSEDKLAEEGWAMMNESNIYDVTFSNGVTRKCWIYQDDYVDNIVDCITLMGSGGFAIGEKPDDDIVLNKSNNTAICKTPYTSFPEENLTYNYFQNSNLSAWKVWYSLNNDKDRFAWADDSVDEDSHASIMAYSRKEGEFPLERDITQDVEGFYAWINNFVTYFTNTETPSTNDVLYDDQQDETNLSILSYTPAHEGTGLPNGRGVIYRLIDEWGNDCPYDFKNIQLYLPIVDGEYVKDGQKIWVYTFCLYNSDEVTYEDGSLKRIEASVDTIYAIFYNNVIVSYLEINRYFSIPFNLLLGYYSIQDEEAFSPSNCEFFNCTDAIVQNTSNAYLYRCRMIDYVVEVGGIYYANKKVLTEG